MDLNLMRDVEVTVGGKRYKLAKLNAGMIDDFREWLRPQVEKRVEAARGFMPLVSKEMADKLATAAMDELRQLEGFSFESPLGMEAIKTSAGFLRLIYLRLLAGHPDATEDDAMEIVLMAGKEEADKAARKVTADPKSPAPAILPGPGGSLVPGPGNSSTGAISSGG